MQRHKHVSILHRRRRDRNRTRRKCQRRRRFYRLSHSLLFLRQQLQRRIRLPRRSQHAGKAVIPMRYQQRTSDANVRKRQRRGDAARDNGVIESSVVCGLDDETLRVFRAGTQERQIPKGVAVQGAGDQVGAGVGVVGEAGGPAARAGGLEVPGVCDGKKGQR